MGKVNSLIFDWQQKIHAIEDYPIKISEAENVTLLNISSEAELNEGITDAVVEVGNLIKVSPTILWLILMVVLAFVIFSSPTFAGKTVEMGVLIINSDVPVEALTKAEVKKLYAGKVGMWSNQTKVQLSVLNSDTEVVKKFFKQILGKSTTKFKKFWLKQTLAGYGTTPLSFRTAEEIIKFVSLNQGAIGFIPESEASNLEKCKQITIDSQSSF